MRRSGKLSTLNVALEDLLAQREGRVRVKERLAALVWRDCVGEFYADRTRVSRVHRGIMYVWCNSPALAHQLSLDAPVIIGRINAELAGPYIKEIRPSTSRSADNPADEVELAAPQCPVATQAELQAVQLSVAELKAIDAKAALIPQEKLREKFRATAIASLRAQKWRETHGYRKCPTCGWLVPPPLMSCIKCGTTV
ncbi:MAG: DUF721 domain-containing protein [Candidatus Zipacnadales bacterium]